MEAVTATQPPNFMVLDVELARKLPGKNFGGGKAGISVMSCWGLRDPAPFVFLLDSDRFPRVLLQEEFLRKTSESFDGIVTWNGVEFDDPTLKVRVPTVRSTWSRKRHVDLFPLCALIAAGVSPEKLTTTLKPGWAGMVPTFREDILTAGWGLDAVARGTLGVRKLEGFTGAASIEAWERGRYSEVSSYNLWDTGITRALFLHVWEHGWLESVERGRVEIPRECLS